MKEQENTFYQLHNISHVWSFGDSWCAGHGLQPNEDRFGDVVARYFNAPHTNTGISGSSLGHILHTFTSHCKFINKGDIVLVIVPPDIRWYDISSDNVCSSLFVGTKKYKNFVKDKSPEWFIYHHSLFIYTIISICESIGANLVLAHNYGKLEFESNFANLIKTNYFLNKDRCLTSLLGGNTWSDNYSPSLTEDGPPGYIEGHLFLPGDTHPNQKGHCKIAQLIIDKLEG